MNALLKWFAWYLWDRSYARLKKAQKRLAAAEREVQAASIGYDRAGQVIASLDAPRRIR